MNKELRKSSEIILKDGRNLEEVLELHKKWLKREEGGIKADLSDEDLSNVDLIDVNLRYADLSGSILMGAYLSNANLSDSDLSYVYLSNANLSDSDLRYSDFSNADLRGVDFSGSDLTGVDLTNTNFYLTNLYKCKGDFVGIENIGSRNDTTHYFYKSDRVICGCFSGTMEEFEEKVKKSYAKDDKEYREYIVAIRTLKELAEIELESNI